MIPMLCQCERVGFLLVGHLKDDPPNHVARPVQHSERGMGKGQICFIPINSRVTLGRNDDNDITFPDDNISRYHCGFVSEGGDVYIEDYRSLNGTMLNNVKLETGSCKLKPGDNILVDRFVLEFRNVHVSLACRLAASWCRRYMARRRRSGR